MALAQVAQQASKHFMGSYETVGILLLLTGLSQIASSQYSQDGLPGGKQRKEHKCKEC